MVFDFYPISVFRLLKMSYWEMFDAYECPTKEMEEETGMEAISR